MFLYALKRILYALPVLIGVNLLVFAMFFLVNSADDMAKASLGEKASNPEQVLRWKEARGYDKPLFFNAEAPATEKFTSTIFFDKSIRMLWGGFGNSDNSGQPVAKEIARRILPSLAIALPIFLSSLVASVIIALILASRRGHIIDRIGQIICVVMMSVSTLVLIISAQYFIAGRLKLCPVSGFDTGINMVKFLLLPILIGFITSLPANIRLYRTYFLEEAGKDYVRTAKAKGLSEETILLKHILKNGMLPILTNVPVSLLMLITGNMLLEKFFNIPGLGGYTIEAIAAQDFAIVRAMVFLGAGLYIVGTLLSDICYCLVDPRIKL